MGHITPFDIASCTFTPEEVVYVRSIRLIFQVMNVNNQFSMILVNFVCRKKSVFMSPAQTILSKSFAFITSFMAESVVCNSAVSKSAVLG